MLDYRSSKQSTGYGSGIVAYIDATGLHGIIAARGDELVDFNDYHTKWGRWSEIIGTGTAIGDGKSNTAKIVKVYGEGEYAAKLCHYWRWYLPSKDELNELYKNRHIIGNFKEDMYWTSSELDKEYAWIQDFGNGNQINRMKTYYYVRVRAIRYF